MGCFSLAETGDVVVLSFDRHQRNTLNLRRIDRFAAMFHLALRQGVLHEHQIDGLQIEFCREIHHRQILIVELDVLVDEIAVAFDEIAEQALVRIDMTIQVHAYEAGQLQEARINIAHEARMRERHLGDDVVAEPVDAFLFCEIVHAGRIAAGIDRTAHQCHRRREVGILIGFHDGHRRQHWH